MPAFTFKFEGSFDWTREGMDPSDDLVGLTDAEVIDLAQAFVESAAPMLPGVTITSQEALAAMRESGEFAEFALFLKETRDSA